MDAPDLEEIAARCLTEFETDGDAAIERACERHPEQADRIRGMVRQLRGMGLIPETAAKPPDRIGEYRILERLGGGGMGEVWLAEQQRLGRRVALKVIHAAHAWSARARERFQREVQALSAIDHPGICPVFDAGEVDGVPFLAMRFVEGATLAARIAESAAPDVAGTLACVEKVARALHFAHERGLVHRDVKPANIIVAADGEPVLLDFGLARHESDDTPDLTRAGDRIGTPAYMAPEQVRGARVDRRTDVYALGVSLYEALTMALPHRGVTCEETYRSILTGEVPRASRANKAIPRDLEIVIETALERDPDRRYATALDFAEDLERVRRRQPVRARPLPIVLRARRFAERHPAMTTAFVIISTALVGLLWLLSERIAIERRLRAQGLILAANELEHLDPPQAFELACRALDLDDSPRVVARVQELQFGLFEVAELAWERAPMGGVEWSPAGDAVLVFGPQFQPTLLPVGAGQPITFGAMGSPAAFLPGTDVIATTDGDHVLAQGWTLAGKRSDVATDALEDTGYAAGGRVLVQHPARLRIAGGPTVAVDAHEDPVWWAGTSGGRVLTSSPRLLRLCDQSGAELGRARGIGADARSQISSAELSPDGERVVATFQGGRLRLYDRDLGFLFEWRTPEERSLGCARFSADSRWIAAGDWGGSIWVLDLELRTVMRLTHPGGVYGLAFSPDGTRIASASSDGKVRVFTLAPPAGTPVLAGLDLAEVTISPDRSRLCVAAAKGEALLCDPGGAVSVRVRLPDGWSRAAFAMDGRRVTIASHDGTVIDVDAATGQIARSTSCGHVVNRVVALADGGVLLQTHTNRVLARETDGSFNPVTVPPVACVAAANDGRTAWAGTWTGAVLQFRSDGTIVRERDDFGAVVTAVAHTRDGAFVLVGRSNATALSWNLATDEVTEFGVHRHAVTAFAESADGSLGATVAMDGKVRVFDLMSVRAGSLVREPRIAFEHPLVFSVVFQSTGRIVTGGGDGTARWWDLDADSLRRRLRR